MSRFVKALVVLLALAALVLPMVSMGHCHEAHEVAHETDCPCLCCAAPDTDGHHALVVDCAPRVQRMALPDVQGLDLILASDIFRPPASA